ncbi:agmatinase [Vibrio vulnificus]|uniref:agmatinase n=1 Tax=Vibrio vulnificus TaxID=672 RepID=UPI003242BDEB
MTHYKPDDSMKTPRFCSIRTFFRLPTITPDDLTGVDLVVTGVPTDSAVGFRTGARFGPEGIRNASILLRPFHPSHLVDITEELSMVDIGDSPVWPGYHLETLQKIEQHFAQIYEQNCISFALGGDHSITIGELRAAHKRYGKLALIHIDAHGDVLDDYYGGIKHFHGTVFRRAVEEGLVDPEISFQIGMRGSIYPQDLNQGTELGFNVISWDELHQSDFAALGKRVRDAVGDRKVFLSFDIDFLDPAFASGTGTPEPGGPSSYEAMQLIRQLGPMNYCGMDLVEVAPVLDQSGATCITAANIAFELLSLVALAKKKGIVKNV